MPEAKPIPGRLRWLCRRGMLELDAWLLSFLDTRHAMLTPAQQVAFASLLREDDMDLFAWLSGGRQAPENYREVVELIRTTRYAKP